MRLSNNIGLQGRIVKDLELKKAGDSDVCRFSLAVNRPYQKDKEQETDFFDCEIWNNPAVFLTKYFSKGDAINLVGELRNTSWDKEDGTKAYRTYVRVENIEFPLTRAVKQKEEAENPIKPLDIQDSDMPF